MGRDVNQRGNSRRWITRAVEDSLRRLQTDHIDLYQIHRPDPSTDIDETIDALTDLVRAGKILAWGTSTFPAADLVETCWAADRRRRRRPALGAAAVLDPLPRHRARRAADLPRPRHRRARVEPAVRRLADRQVPPRRRCPGRLPRRHQPRSLRRFEPGQVRRRRAALGAIADEAGVSLTHLALAWSTEHPAVTSALIGPRTEAQLDDLLGASDVVLDGRRARRHRRRRGPRRRPQPRRRRLVPAGLGPAARRR